MEAPISLRAPDGEVVGDVAAAAEDDGLSQPSQAVSATDEDDSRSEEWGGADVDENGEQLIHWWCRKRLLRFLKKLCSMEAAQAFLEPIPWEELGLTDYPDIVEQPIDLKTVGDRLDAGFYHDQDGLVDPDIFFGDIALIWDNCQLYYEGDEKAEPFTMAEEMREDAETMEDEFWAELEEFESSLAADDPAGSNVATVTAVADVAAGQVEELMGRLNNWWWGGEDAAFQNWTIPTVQARDIKKTVIESVAGKGHIKLVMKGVVPTEPEDREALIGDVIDSLAIALGTGPEHIEVDWDHIWKDADLHKYDSNAAQKHQLDIPYCLRLDDAKKVTQIVEEFNAARAKRCLQEKLGAGMSITVSEMIISKTSRRPLGDHFFDVIQEKCDYDASHELLEIEDDLCHALEQVLEQIMQIDEEEKQYKDNAFPEAHLKKPLEMLRRPAFLPAKGPQSVAASRAGSRRGSEVGKVLSNAINTKSPSRKPHKDKDGASSPADENKMRRASIRAAVTKEDSSGGEAEAPKFQTIVSLKNIFKKRDAKPHGEAGGETPSRRVGRVPSGR